MPVLGPTELILILAIVVLIFGAGRLADVGGALGRSLREFREATTEERESASGSHETAALPTCRRCGLALHGGARFCGSCGAAIAEQGLGASLLGSPTQSPAHDSQ
jgi:sec-independent protein translocase protein TatA